MCETISMASRLQDSAVVGWQSDASEFFCPVCLLCASQFGSRVSPLYLGLSFVARSRHYSMTTREWARVTLRCGSAGMAVAFAAFC